MPDFTEGNIATSINDITALVASLRSGALNELLRPGGVLADCTNHCECKGLMCGCNNIVSGREWDDLSYPEFLQSRQRRIDELRSRLRELESGPGDVEGGPAEGK
jgi:hypothetical protein